jgi:DNA-binding response OmpR family regulator
MGAGPAETRVLVVEDEPEVGDLFETMLSEYAVQRAHNGGEALATLDDDIDVVLLDRRMPDISGDQVLEEIDSRGIDCRVAMVSAVDPDFDVIDMGFDDYLTKPVRAEGLREAVERLRALDEYEQKYQELSSKLVTKNILEVEKTPAELEESDRFRELQARIEELEAEPDEMQAEAGFDERLLPSSSFRTDRAPLAPQVGQATSEMLRLVDWNSVSHSLQ